MDLRTEKILKTINLHLKIKSFLTIICYFFIIGGLFIYIFHAIGRSSNIKLITQYKEKAKSFQTEKIMTNPRMKFQYSEDEVYDIRAKKAFHKDEKEITLYDVFAIGKAGNITAGQLKVEDEGDHLIFTENPVMILNKTQR